MTSSGRVVLLCLQWILLKETSCGSQVAGRRIFTRPNTVIGVNSSCSADTLTARVRLEKPFSGVVYAKGFPLECRIQGSGDSTASLVLPAAGCGVKVLTTEDGAMTYSVALQIQLDRHLQQMADQEHTVECQLSPQPPAHRARPSTRTGRKQLIVPGREHLNQEPQRIDDDGRARAWLDISGSRGQSYVTVGELTRLRIKALLPAGHGIRVVDCLAHDGVGETSQRLLDEEGCPVDESLLPALSTSSPPQKVHLAQTVFPAFKFPDRDSLHLRCELQVCKGACPQVQCEEWTDSGQVKLQSGEILERLEVFNSVQVLAPGIETYDMQTSDQPEEDAGSPSRPGAGRAVCLSPPKMVLVLSVLVLVFLCGVAVVLWTAVQGRKPPGRRWFDGQDSLLVVESPQLVHRPQWRVLR